MKKKITFVRNERKKSRGITPRCEKIHARTGASCRKPEGHTGNCEWSIAVNANRKACESSTSEKPAKKHKHVSRETRLSCLEMIEDPIYRRKLLVDLRARRLRPAVECLLWYYAKGKPKEMVEHSGQVTLTEELSQLSTEELKARAQAVVKMLTHSDSPSKLTH